jgi:hypothetical protein
MPVLVSSKTRVHVPVGSKCVVAALSVEGVCLPMVTTRMLLGRSRALLYRVFRPRRGGGVTLAPRVTYGLMATNGARTSPDTLTCS